MGTADFNWFCEAINQSNCYQLLPIWLADYVHSDLGSCGAIKQMPV